MGISTSITKYHSSNKDEWDDFVNRNNPSLVLHYRSYMEYHSERFNDFSICFWNGNTLVAIVPGNADGKSWHSHQGLTFGGLITSKSDLFERVSFINLMHNFLMNEGFNSSSMTVAPNSFYPHGNADSVYVLQQAGYQITAVHLNQYLERGSSLPAKKVSNARAALRKGSLLSTNLDLLPQIYALIAENLMAKYSRNPVHSLAELHLLCSKFPKEIDAYSVTLEKQVVAGAIVFQSGDCSHIQYLAANVTGKKIRAQDYLVNQILEKSKSANKNLSFGKSTAGESAILNTNLFHFKEEFGSQTENIFTFTKNLL
jgi:hypothetical protein